jgi:leucyl/phenylalanyl-tRNA--protein transferase
MLPNYLTPEILLKAYLTGYFPMAESAEGSIEWFSPDPRAIIPLDGVKISKSLRKAVEKEIFEIKIDTCFETVMKMCANRNGEETWISDEIVEAFTALHHMGYAHCVESWFEGELVGGLYGVCINGAYFGESMFSRKTDASKVAFVHLTNRLRERGFLLLDSQFINPHSESLGAIEIPRVQYLEQLLTAISANTITFK